jgi:hypothetical protein
MRKFIFWERCLSNKISVSMFFGHFRKGNLCTPNDKKT